MFLARSNFLSGVQDFAQVKSNLSSGKIHWKNAFYRTNGKIRYIFLKILNCCKFYFLAVETKRKNIEGEIEEKSVS